LMIQKTSNEISISLALCRLLSFVKLNSISCAQTSHNILLKLGHIFTF
jgi:hypothetical protein